MPHDTPLSLRGTVAPAGDVALELSGLVTGGAMSELELSGTVSITVREAVMGRSSAHGVLLRIAGRDVPPEDLAGPVEISDELDTPNTILKFSVRGVTYSFVRTLTTWTTVPVELLTTHSAGAAAPLASLDFRGYLVPMGGRQRGIVDPELALTADTIAACGEGMLCAEVLPSAALTRREIAAAIIEPTGVSLMAPGGPVHPRPLEVMDRTPLAFLLEWGEAAGWHWRMLPGAGEGEILLEGYTAPLKTAPQAADETWTADDCESIDPEPPSKPLSKVVVRGLRTLAAAGANGVEVEVETIEIRRPYALKTAVEEQLTTGEVVAVSGSSPEAERVVTRVENEVHRKGGLEIAVITREWGFDNPKAARLRTPEGSEADGPEDGYYFTRAWIDEEGEYRFFRAERWMLKSERRIRRTYGPAGTLDKEEIEDYRRRSYTAGVKEISAGVPGPWQKGIGVGTDDQSHFVFQKDGDRRRIDDFGLAERHVVSHRYDEAKGAEAGTSQVSDGYYSPRGAVDVDGHWLRFDGSAQIDAVAPFRRFAELDKATGLTTDGRVASETEAKRGWFALTKKDGAHDWGGAERSHRVSEIFRTTEAKVVVWRRSGDGSAERLEITPNGPPTVERVVEATIPLPRFGESEWTSLRQEPWEFVLGPVDADLWGSSSIAVENPHLATPEEGEALARRLRDRSVSPRLRVRRLETLARPGDTIRVIDPHQGLDHRCLLASRRRSLDPRTGAFVGDYVLEVAL